MTTVNLLLVDGTANGRIKCTISGRTGIIFKIPRKHLAKNDREELKRDGVYFLLGEENGQPTVYIGQAGSRKNGKGILGRLNEHDHAPDKSFFTEAITFTTSDNSFGATEISWLENKFCDMAIKAARYAVKNGNDPSPGNITEEKEIELEEQAEFAQLILSAIGYKIFEPQKKIIPPPITNPDEEIFYLSRNIKKLGRSINAQMKRIPTGFKVLAGSEISPIEDITLSANVKKARHSAKIDSNGNLLEDVEFSQSSPAATFVIGKPASGNDYWRTRDGVPLKIFLQEET